MQQHLLSRICKLGFFGGIILNMAACQGNDSKDTSTKDSAVAVTTAVKTAKKKGKTSTVYSPTNNGKFVKDAHGIYNQAEVAPQFPGGKDALSNYINNNLAYSQALVDSGINGTIHVTFIVDEHGKVLNPKIADSKILNEGLNEETLKMFNNMPSWTPGSVKGKNVKTRMQLPVTFQVEDKQ